jgi:hypothetical protein
MVGAHDLRETARGLRPQLAFPHAHDRVSAATRHTAHPAIPTLIPRDLRRPVRRIRFRDMTATWTTVKKATVDKDN